MFYPLGLHCRHETPVLSKPIDVIHLSEDLVVLDKPCSLPVSVQCYNYQMNFYLNYLYLTVLLHFWRKRNIIIIVLGYLCELLLNKVMHFSFSPSTMSKFKMVQMIKVKSFIILYDCIITYVTNITKNITPLKNILFWWIA